jgi:Zn-dependent M28 family amino/carboxypeptidase
MAALGTLGCAGSPEGRSAEAATSQALARSNDSAIAPASVEIAPLTAAPQAQAAPPLLKFDAKRAWTHLQRQVEIGPRPSGTAAINKARDYISAQLAAAGIASKRQVFIAMTPLGEMSMANVIATIPGRRPERIILASHFDTKLFRDVRFVGANDGASSTAALLELGRVLKSRQNEFTVELLFLDGEEAVIEWQGNDHTYGSRHYVQAAQKSGDLARIKALVLLDMIGDSNLVIRRDSNSTPWLVDIIWAAAERLNHRAAFSNELTSIEDDHIPFLRAGVPAVDVIDLDNPTWHTPKDTLEYVSEKSLQTVGDVILAAFPDIEARLKQ